MLQKLENCLLQEKQPSLSLQRFSEEPWFREYPFSLLLAQKQTEQSPQHHPEGTVWNHTLLVVDQAAKYRQESRNPRALLWAALLHDIGKPTSTRRRKGRITAYDHDKVGGRLARDFLSALTEEKELIETVSWLVRYHMQALFVVKALPFQDLAGMRAHTDLRELALLCFCDRTGRLGAVEEREKQEIALFWQRCGEGEAPSWMD